MHVTPFIKVLDTITAPIQEAASDLNVFNLYDIKAHTTISYYQILQHIVYLHWSLRLCSFEAVHANNVSVRRVITEYSCVDSVAYLYYYDAFWATAHY